MDHEKPLSRRAARARRTSADVDASASEPTFDDLLSSGAVDDAPPTEAEIAKKRRRKRRRWIGLIVFLLIVGLIVAGAFAAKRIYDQAMGVRDHLQASMVEVKEVQRAVLAGELDAASAASSRLSVETSAAVSGTHGRLWSLAEAVPLVGNNLSAVRTVAEVTDQLATDVVAPASSVSLDAFQPKGGGIDLDAVAGLSSLIGQVSIGIDQAISELGSVDREGLIDQVSSGVNQLDDALAGIQPMIGSVKDILGVLPDALGASGPRDYLLMFQGNSEARSLGGNAAVFIVVRADDGRLEVTGEVQSRDFKQARAEPVIPLDPEAVAIYGDKIGRWTPDFTMIPNFPSAVEIFDGWRQDIDSRDFDGVVSVDPVALSYVLAATGPVDLPTGEVLSTDNAVSLLLNEVYFRYDPDQQNLFFSAAADAIFNQITRGGFTPIPLISALARSAEEGRLLYSSTNSAEAELIAGSRMSGVMPSDSLDETLLGVYVNDNTGSKKSYYLDMDIKACRSSTEVHGEVTLTSTLTADEAKNLPYYVTGPYFAAADISTYVVLYGPPNSKVTELEIDGEPVSPTTAGKHLGRTAVKVEVNNHLESAHTLRFTFADVSAENGPLQIWHTPMVRDTGVNVEDACPDQ